MEIMKRSLCILAPLVSLLLPVLMNGDSLNIVSRTDWGALEARPDKPQTPSRFTIHHSAVTFDRDRDAAEHIRNIQSWGMGEDRNWTDIPYHFIIAPTGDIFEGRNPFVAGESNTPYDTTGHLQINLLGNFSEQDPTSEQLDSLVRLMAWAHKKFDIPVDSIKAHRDFASTNCPGDRLYPLVEDGTLLERTNERLTAEAAKEGDQ